MSKTALDLVGRMHFLKGTLNPYFNIVLIKLKQIRIDIIVILQ
jgi:hypothetical protein